MPAKILSNRYYFDAQYDQNNNKISANHSDGLKQRYEYDDKNRLVHYKSIDAESRIYEIFYEYNDIDHSIISIDSDNIKEQFWYTDDWKYVLKKVLNNGSSITYQYDESNRMIKVVDDKGITQITEYDDENKSVINKTSLGYQSISIYSDTGKILSFKSSKGVKTFFEYDDQDRIIREYDESMHKDTRYEYKDDLIIKRFNNGNVEVSQIKDGKVIRLENHIYIKKYKYDESGNLIFYERQYNKELNENG